MTHRRPLPLVAAALGAGLLLTAAPAASAAPSKAERMPETSVSAHKAGPDANRALDKLRRAVLADVVKADARVVEATAPSSKNASLTAAHRDALTSVTAAVRAELAELRSQVDAAGSAPALLALRRAVPSHAGAHLSQVVRLLVAADRALASSTAADAALVEALDAAIAIGGKDLSGLQADAARLLENAAAARLRAAGDADAALAVGRRLAEKKLPAAVKTVNRSVGALKGATDDVADLTDEVAVLPVVEPQAEAGVETAAG